MATTMYLRTPKNLNYKGVMKMGNNENKNDKKQSKYMAYGMCFWHDCG